MKQVQNTGTRILYFKDDLDLFLYSDVISFYEKNARSVLIYNESECFIH